VLKDKVNEAVQVEVRSRGDGFQLVLWSYGHRARYYNYESKFPDESPTNPNFYRFVKTCAIEYVVYELGWNDARLVSGPHLVGPDKYILVFSKF
jgi:hypothetical protein